MKKCRLRFGERGDFLDVTITSDYVHFHLVSPGRQFGIQDVYVPRHKLPSLLLWLAKSARVVPPRKKKKQVYVPDAIRRAAEKELLYERDLRLAKRAGHVAKSARRL